MKVAVFGLGYVGTVTAACLAWAGHDVWGVDVDATKVGLVSSGRSTVVEPGLDSLVARGVAEGRLHATTSALEALEGADVSPSCASARRRRPGRDGPHVRPPRGRGRRRGPGRGRPAGLGAARRRGPLDGAAGHGRRGRGAGAGRDPRRAEVGDRRCARSSSARARASPTSSTRRSSWSARRGAPAGRRCYRAVRVPRRAGPRRRRADGGGAQVRLQRLPRDQDRRSPTRSAGCCRHSASTPAR